MWPKCGVPDLVTQIRGGIMARERLGRMGVETGHHARIGIHPVLAAGGEKEV